MSGVPLNPDEHERNAEVDRVILEICCRLDDPCAEIGIYYFREAQKVKIMLAEINERCNTVKGARFEDILRAAQEEREAREDAERERDLIAKTYADVAHCIRCPARNREMYGFNQCGKPCAESILEWAKAQEVHDVQP